MPPIEILAYLALGILALPAAVAVAWRLWVRDVRPLHAAPLSLVAVGVAESLVLGLLAAAAWPASLAAGAIFGVAWIIKRRAVHRETRKR